MKSTFLLTTAIFLLSAPAPDSKVLAEASAGLLAPKHESGLLASDQPADKIVKPLPAKKQKTEPGESSKDN